MENNIFKEEFYKIESVIEGAFTKHKKFKILPLSNGCCGEVLDLITYKLYLNHYPIHIGLASNPYEANVLVVSGNVDKSFLKVISTTYNLMENWKRLVVFGTCACSSNFFNSTKNIGSVSSTPLVDLFIPGEPPVEEALFFGINKLIES